MGISFKLIPSTAPKRSILDESKNAIGKAVQSCVETATESVNGFKEQAKEFDAGETWNSIPGNDYIESVAQQASETRDNLRDSSIDRWNEIPGNNVAEFIVQDAVEDLPFDNVISATAQALAGSTAIQLEQDALDAIQADPDFIRIEGGLVTEIEKRIAQNGELGPEGLTIPLPELVKDREDLTLSVTLGGTRGSLNPLSPDSLATWQVAGNELTWLLRHAQLDGTANVSQSGEITIDYTITDILDLRPGVGLGFAYDVVTTVTGAVWHDVMGAEEAAVTGQFSTSPQSD